MLHASLDVRHMQATIQIIVNITVDGFDHIDPWFSNAFASQPTGESSLQIVLGRT
jgi:hypothetical protein